jgi:hypothetical protein
MQVDDCTINKLKMDYRILISMSCLEDINVIEEILVDDLDFGLAEDACLVEEEVDKESVYSETHYLQDDVQVVETLVQQIHDNWSSREGWDIAKGDSGYHGKCFNRQQERVQFVQEGNVIL